MIKKGDNVRFMNAVGGGIVTRVDEAKKIVYVEDADGFEMPVQERECLVIVSINSETNFPIKDFRTKTATPVPVPEPQTTNLKHTTSNSD